MPRPMNGIRRGSHFSSKSVKPAANAGLTLYAARDTADSDWVRLVLAEKEVDHARVLQLTPGQFDEDLALLNPALSLPTIADREGVLTGAAVIAEYLDERYPQPKLMPPAPAERARMRMMLSRLDQQLFPLAARADGGDAAAASELRGLLYENIIENTRRHGAQGWFLGFDYNLIDCAWAVLLRRPSKGVAVPPGVRQYAQRLFARPAFQRSF